MAVQDLTVELYYDGAWNDHTTDVYARDAATIRAGRADALSAVPPSTATFTLDNRDGDANPANPTSSLYGKVGESTPVRMSIGTPHVGDSNSSTSSTTSHVAPSVTSPTDDAMLLCAWGAPDPSNTYTVPVSMTAGPTGQGPNGTVASAYEAISATGATGTRTATYGAVESYVAASVLLHGTSPSIASSTAFVRTPSSAISVTAGQWLVLLSYMGWDDSDEVIPDFPYDDDGGGWIKMADTGTVDMTPDPDATYNRMIVWAKRIKVSGTITPEVDTTSQNRTIAYVVSGVTDWDMRFWGEITSMQPSRSIKGDAWVTVSAAGPSQRLGIGRKPVNSALRAYLPDTDPAGYWPMEDRDRLTNVADSRYPMSVTGAELVWDQQGAAGSGTTAGIKVTDDRGALSVARGHIAGNGDDWTVSLWFKASPGPEGAFSVNRVDFIEIELDVAGTANDIKYWNLNTISTPDVPQYEVRAYAYDPDHTLITTPATFGAITTDVDPMDGNWHMITLSVSQSGGTATATLALDDEAATDTDTDTTWSNGALSAVYVASPDRAGRVTDFSVAHVVAWNSTAEAASAQIAERFNVGRGRPGELAGRRLLRLCRQEGVTCAVVGDPDETQPMGPQRVDTLPALLREIADTDDATIGDARTFLGLSMRTGRSRYNRGAVLTLDYDASEVAAGTEQEISNRYVRNEVTAARRDGSTAVATRTSGPNNTSSPTVDAEGVGMYTRLINVNPMSDATVADHAGWHLHLGTDFPKARYPLIVVDPDRHPSLAAAAGAVNLGDVVAIDNLPTTEHPDSVYHVAIGVREVIGTHRRIIRVDAVPAQPLQILEIGHATQTTIAPGGTTLNEDLDTTETGVDITCGHGGPWVHEGTDYGISVGGEQMTVTAVSASAGTFPNETQTLTVTRSVNGVVKTHSTGADVRLHSPSFIGL